MALFVLFFVVGVLFLCSLLLFLNSCPLSLIVFYLLYFTSDALCCSIHLSQWILQLQSFSLVLFKILTISLVKSSFCLFMYFPPNNIFLSFLVIHWNFFKTVILNSLSAKLQYSAALSSVVGELYLLGVTYFDFTCSLDFCTSVFPFEVADTSLNLYGCFPMGSDHWCCYVWGFLSFWMGRPAPVLLSLVADFLSFISFFSSYN